MTKRFYKEFLSVSEASLHKQEKRKLFMVKKEISFFGKKSQIRKKE